MSGGAIAIGAIVHVPGRPDVGRWVVAEFVGKQEPEETSPAQIVRP